MSAPTPDRAALVERLRELRARLGEGPFECGWGACGRQCAGRSCVLTEAAAALADAPPTPAVTMPRPPLELPTVNTEAL